MSIVDLYLSCARFSCFDGEGEGGGDGGAGTGDGGAGGAPGGQGAGEAKAPADFTPEQQKKFNEAIAAEKRKWQTSLQKAEQTYKDMLTNSTTLSEKERKVLEENLATIAGQLRSKEEEAKRKLTETEQTYQNKLKEAEARAESAETRYRQATINRALKDAAHSNDAFNPDQIVRELHAMTKLVEVVDEKTGRATGQFKVVVEFPDKDATTGQDIMTVKSPEEAVKRMKELPESANLFKHNVVSGVGGNSAIGGLTPGSNGRIDPRSLTPAQYREVRAKNPELLGLRPKGR
jgi:hypothetical protein